MIIWSLWVLCLFVAMTVVGGMVYLDQVDSTHYDKDKDKALVWAALASGIVSVVWMTITIIVYAIASSPAPK